MAKNTKQTEPSTSPTTYSFKESNEVITMEYVVKKYISNIEIMSGNDTLGNTSPLKPYLEEVVRFVSSYNLARGFILTLTETEATKLWYSIRTDYKDIVSFLMHITSEFRMIYNPSEYREICRKIAYATGFVYNPKYSIIAKVDETFVKTLRKQDDIEEEINFLENNPWLVSMYLISLINPIG